MTWKINSVVPIIAFVLYSGLYLIVVSSKPRTPAKRAFMLYLLANVLWSLSAFFVLIDTQRTILWFRVMSACGLATYILIYNFVQSFLEKRKIWSTVVLIYAFLAMILTVSTNLVIASATSAGGLITNYEFAPLIGVVVGPGYIVGLYSIYTLIRGILDTEDIIRRNRISYLLFGIVVGFIGTFINFTPLGKYPFDIAANGITALIIAYSILRYQLLDIRIVIRQGMLYSIPTIIIGTTYFLVITLFINLFGLFSGGGIFITSLVVAVLTALIAEPLRVRAQAIIDRMFFREKYNSTQMLQTLSGSVASVLDIYKITTMILDEVCSTLHIPMASFFLRDQVTGRFQLTTQIGQDEAQNIEFRQGHPMVLWLLSHDKPLTRHDMEVLPQFQSLWHSERKDLELLNAELFIPIKVHDVLVGIFLVGSKRSEQAYTMEDILTLSTVANQTAVAIENARLYTSEQTRLHEMDVLYSMARRLVTLDNFEDVVRVVAQHAVDSTKASYARILTREENGDYTCRAVHSLAQPLDDLNKREVEPLVAEHYYNWIMQGGQPEVVQSNDPDLHPEERAVLFYNGAKSICLSPLKGVDKNIGLLILGNDQSLHEDAFPLSKQRLINVISDYAASAIQRAILHEQLEETFLETIIALANAVDARDSYTGDHSQRMAEISSQIGRVMNLPTAEIEALHWASILHDIGKIGVPDEILNKKGPLTKKEWGIMKEHPVTGAQIVAPVKYLARVSPIILAHHERIDGTGYPYGLEGVEIPLGSRILAVVDAYVAIRDKRVYSEAHSHEEAVAELRRASGTQFDSEIVDVFCKTITE